MSHPCVQHSGVCSEITNLEKVIAAEKVDRIEDKKEIWKAIDAMRMWVIGGMAALILA